MIIKNDQIDYVQRDNMDIKILSKASDFENASFALIKVKDRHGKTISNVNDRIYYVTEGEGTFQINGEDHSVVKGDVVVVPKQSEYDFWGQMSVFLVHVPAFKPE